MARLRLPTAASSGRHNASLLSVISTALHRTHWSCQIDGRIDPSAAYNHGAFQHAGSTASSETQGATPTDSDWYSYSGLIQAGLFWTVEES